MAPENAHAASAAMARRRSHRGELCWSMAQVTSRTLRDTSARRAANDHWLVHPPKPGEGLTGRLHTCYTFPMAPENRMEIFQQIEAAWYHSAASAIITQCRESPNDRFYAAAFWL